MAYTERKESVTALWLARARAEQGWKVASVHFEAGSKVWMDERIELASKPVRPSLTLMLESMYLPVQKLCAKQRTWGAASAQPVQVWPRVLARAAPSARARWVAARVKKEEPLTSSQRSKPVWFQ
jgi:hypothetical protein